MAGAKTAKKNQRPNSLGSKRATPVGDFRLIIPCNSGRNAYVFNVATAKNPHVRTDSEQFLDLLREGVEQGHGRKLRAELVQLHTDYPAHGWDATLARAEAAQVFG